MSGRLWLYWFIKSFIKSSNELDNEYNWTDKEWTEFLGNVLNKTAKKMHCHVAQRSPDNKEESGEYLNIDGWFIRETEYQLMDAQDEDKWDPLVLPSAVVELENSYDVKKLSYCLWKILCVRSLIRVLICYQPNEDKIVSLREHLENVIWNGGLLKRTDGDILLIIGNESIGNEEAWGKYFNVFEWRGDRLVKIEGLKWS